jgi:diguanylate cyclase (GGDEF)-like protein/PAS domain S-box-containing protein
MHILYLTFSLVCFLEVVVLILHYRKGNTHKGFIWWYGSIFFLSLYFLLAFFQSVYDFGSIYYLFKDVLITGSSLLLYVGMLQFYNKRQQWQNLVIFFTAYMLISIFLYIADILIALDILAALSIAVISTISGRLIYTNAVFNIDRFRKIFSITCFIFAVVFLGLGIILLVAPLTSPPIQTLVEPFTSLIIFIVSVHWTVGFIVFTNQRVENKSIEAKGKYNLMFKTIPDALLITRLTDGYIVEVNDGFVKLSGYTQAEAEGKSVLDIHLWFDPSERQKFVTLLTEKGSIVNMEFRFRRKNGKPIFGVLSAKTFELNGVMHILSSVHDITTRKKMEEKLRENQEKYRFLTDNSADVIWHINTGYRIDYISAADERLRGFKPEEVIGQPIWSIFKPEGTKLVREKIEHHRQKEQVGNNMNVTRFEIQQRCKDGSWVWTEICAAPHYNNEGDLIGYHGINRDITDRKRVFDELYHQATIDDLTRVPNRRHFMYLAEKEMKSAKRYHRPISIIVVDFDSLKKINDTYGHLAGDRALSVFSKIVQQIIREVDILGRFGGDEFLILLPETDEDQAFHVMERINQVLASSPIFYQDSSFSISISAGIASIENWTDTLEDLLTRADEALYEAKEKGGKKISTNHNSKG